MKKKNTEIPDLGPSTQTENSGNSTPEAPKVEPRPLEVGSPPNAQPGKGSLGADQGEAQNHAAIPQDEVPSADGSGPSLETEKESSQPLPDPPEKTLEEIREKYLRLYAEYDNFRKRTQKERLALFESANKSLIEVILPVLDDFERALNLDKTIDENTRKGFSLIFDKLTRTLELHHLKPMATRVGDKFDDTLHEAVTSTPVNSKKKNGKIVDILAPGYMLGDKVLRFAKVVVGKEDNDG